jgi:peptide/nickel transport system ATP-binding protein
VSLLEVQDLTVRYSTKRGEVHAVERISFRLDRGEALGLVGESGSGKTTAAMALMRLLASNARVLEGKIIFKGEDLLLKDDEQMRRIRWGEIAMIFQAAMNALNPVRQVGDQIREALELHSNLGKEESDTRVQELYRMVGLDPSRRNDYPHQYSGGMKQRAIIAMAMACNPAMIIADEPTTALDVIVQDQILAELCSLQKKFDMAMLYISHDISIITKTCDLMGIMYAGQLVEYGPTDEILEKPIHPYTQGLLSSYPTVKGEKKRLVPIPGEPPNLLDPNQGCRFSLRCQSCKQGCSLEHQVFREISPGHFLLCSDEQAG